MTRKDAEEMRVTPDLPPEELLELTTDIVSAYVAKNPIPMAALPDLVTSVSQSLLTVAGMAAEPSEKQKPAVAIRGAVRAELDRLPGMRETVPVAAPAPRQDAWNDGRGIPAEMGAAPRLSDVGAGLFQEALKARQGRQAGAATGCAHVKEGTSQLQPASCTALSPDLAFTPSSAAGAADQPPAPSSP